MFLSYWLHKSTLQLLPIHTYIAYIHFIMEALANMQGAICSLGTIHVTHTHTTRTAATWSILGSSNMHKYALTWKLQIKPPVWPTSVHSIIKKGIQLSEHPYEPLDPLIWNCLPICLPYINIYIQIQTNTDSNTHCYSIKHLRTTLEEKITL